MIVAALTLAASSPAPLRPGIWGDVVTSKQSGDYGGIELRISSADAGRIDLVVCEGGCSPIFHPAVTRTLDGFRFDVAEPMEDGKGRPASLPPRHCVARFEGRQLIVSWTGEGTIDRLRRLRRPHALVGPHDMPILAK